MSSFNWNIHKTVSNDLLICAFSLLQAWTDINSSKSHDKAQAKRKYGRGTMIQLLTFYIVNGLNPWGVSVVYLVWSSGWLLLATELNFGQFWLLRLSATAFYTATNHNYDDNQQVIKGSKQNGSSYPPITIHGRDLFWTHWLLLNPEMSAKMIDGSVKSNHWLSGRVFMPLKGAVNLCWLATDRFNICFL